MQKFRYFKHCLWLGLFIFQNTICGQIVPEEISKLDYEKIYAYCLDGNVKSVLPLLEVDTSQLSKNDIQFKKEFESRFKANEDHSEYLVQGSSRIYELHTIFRDYWRKSLLDSDNPQDRFLAGSAIKFLKTHHLPVKDKEITRDNLGLFLSEYIKKQGYFTTQEVGKTGGIYDLLVWKTQRDTTYSFGIKNEKIETKVVFMKDFVTLGWEEYATLGKYYPGGWTKNDVIYCVEDSYDLESEDFRISYLAHEGQHFLDNRAFPGLKGVDLEYRAKLSELSLAKNTLYDLIQTFFSNSNVESTNPHPLANYRVAHNLSKVIFNTDFESDLNKWETINPKKINRISYKLLKQNTKLLKQNKF